MLAQLTPPDASNHYNVAIQTLKSQPFLHDHMIYTLKVTLLGGFYAESECIKTIEIDSSSTLEILHRTILDAVDFDNDHLYEFYVARTTRSRDRKLFCSFDDYEEYEAGNSEEVKLESLFPLEKGRHLFYMFDFGDSWVFKIAKSRKKPTKPEKGVRYPRVIESIGENPEQYPAFEE